MPILQTCCLWRDSMHGKNCIHFGLALTNETCIFSQFSTQNTRNLCASNAIRNLQNHDFSCQGNLLFLAYFTPHAVILAIYWNIMRHIKVLYSSKGIKKLSIYLSFPNTLTYLSYQFFKYNNLFSLMNNQFCILKFRLAIIVQVGWVSRKYYTFYSKTSQNAVLGQECQW